MHKPSLPAFVSNSNPEDGQVDPVENVAKLIDNLSAYQLYRLQNRINIMLEDPQRLRTVAREVVPRREIEYFCQKTNCCTRAVVDKVNRTTVDVTNLDDGGRWRIELAAVKTSGEIEQASPQIASGQLSRQNLSVGQIVGFETRDHEEMFGTIIRLNSKSVTLESEFGSKWRVAYSLLFPVVDADSFNAGHSDAGHSDASHSDASHSEKLPQRQLLFE